jgi:hypothetical protein
VIAELKKKELKDKNDLEKFVNKTVANMPKLKQRSLKFKKSMDKPSNSKKTIFLKEKKIESILACKKKFLLELKFFNNIIFLYNKKILKRIN